MKHKLESRLSGRNINNLRYADNNTLTAESEEDLKSLFLKVKEESEKAGLEFNIQKTNKDSIWIHHVMADRWGKVETLPAFLFWGSKSTTDGECCHEIKNSCSLEEKLCQT